MYVLTLVMVYPIFIYVGVLGVFKLRIYILFVIFFMEILQASVTLSESLVFISSRVQRERSTLFITLFDEFRELWG